MGSFHPVRAGGIAALMSAALLCGGALLPPGAVGAQQSPATGTNAGDPSLITGLAGDLEAECHTATDLHNYTQALDVCARAAGLGSSMGMVAMGVMNEQGLGTAQDYGKATQWYQEAADAGNAEGLTGLGEMYANGEGVAPDIGKARQFIEKAAAMGDPQARHYLTLLPPAPAPANSGVIAEGKCLEDADNGNYGAALADCMAAAEAGDADAAHDLGQIYGLGGKSLPQDFAKSAQWLKKAADAGVTDAMVELGELYENGLGVGQDYGQALAWYQRAADANDSVAMRLVAAFYANGFGVTRDMDKAGRWQRKAAALETTPADVAGAEKLCAAQMGSGDLKDANATCGKIADRSPLASMVVAALALRGEGGRPKSASTALGFARHAADADYDYGMAELAQVYKDTGNLPQALIWARHAADLGNIAAMEIAGSFYAAGDGTPRNVDEARYWLQKAVDHGGDGAIVQLARLPAAPHAPATTPAAQCHAAFGSRDFATALTDCRQAATGGDASAMTTLATLYDEGLGVSADPDQARQWLEKAAAAGDGDAGIALEFMPPPGSPGNSGD